ncbi:hypothetical protein M3Y97_01153200 [Aphelenchoides bicaudatus]|nr:hypothetical protein M3Y97_01153200 [Aphelenchoides bicaudatus]
MDYWKNSVVKMSEIQLVAVNTADGTMCTFPNNNCSLPYVTQEGLFLLSLNYVPIGVASYNVFYLFYLENFNNVFKFDVVDGGKCTNVLPTFPDDYDDLNPTLSLYDACICCDDYAPNRSLLSCP